MQVSFTSRGAEGDELRDQVVQRVEFAMRRMTWLAPKATVELADINGSDGGVDKRCLVEIKTQQAGTVVVTSIVVVGAVWEPRWRLTTIAPAMSPPATTSEPMLLPAPVRFSTSVV